MSNLPIQDNTPLLNSLLEKANSLPDANERFEAGKKSEYDAFWDALQQNGTRAHYSYAFAYTGWTDSIYKPKYPITPINKSGISDMFVWNQDITDTKVPITVHGSGARAFYQAGRLKRIPKLIFSGATNLTNMFFACGRLEELNCEGAIDLNGLDVSPCPRLTHASLMSIINCLKDYSASNTTYTVTLGADNLAKLTDAEKQIATQKGWTLA